MKYILTIVCFAVSLTSRCQDSERQRYWEFGFFRGGPSYAYFYDGNHYFEGGLKLNLIKNDHMGRAFGIIPGFQFTRSNDVGYVNPFASINCFFDTNQDFTCTVRLSLNREKRLGIVSQKFTPELGFGNYVWGLFMGYNMFLKDTFPESEMYRVSFRVCFN